jgi:prepilin-type N-terminal cleavage/methylation domain-containing protein
MKFKSLKTTGGFTLSEMLISVSVSSIVLAAVVVSSVSLQKSFSAVDNYFATHMQQVRIIDYLSRDVNRGLSVTTSVDLQTVTINVPNYIIRAGDSEAVTNPSLIGTPRSPTVAYTSSGLQINYGASTSTVVYSINNSSIQRTENGAVTTIASSTDQLIPQTTDVELANTEYANTAVTFMPIFTMGGSPAARTGTSLYGTAYLRNKRRG